MPSEFVHLHNHSDFSLLDGAQSVPTLLNTVSDLKMDTLAVTEHGTLFSAIKFYKQGKESGIKPIIGCEAYVAHGSRFDKTPRREGGWGNHHLVLLARDFTGYQNLIKLVTAGYLEGFYYRPRMDKELLRKFNDGLICLSACLKGEVQEYAVRGDYERARGAALELAEIFPGRFYLELQNHDIPEEDTSRQVIARLAGELNLPLVATNDCHYARKEHWEAHDILFCLGTGKDRDDPKRQRYATPEFYVKSQDEMYNLFKQYPQALENTRLIAESCHLEIPLGANLLPTFPIPSGAQSSSPDEYLELRCREALKELYDPVTPELEKRLAYELDVIHRMGYAGYFLIVMDFVNYARKKGIPVGPGRGSVAGSLAAYTLGITTIDPIRHQLLFERFLNPERISMPDIDIDFCYERRGEVIEYIKERYGHDSVTQIITFGKLKARQVVRDVGRVLGLGYGQVDRIAKMIPLGPGVTLDGALQVSSELQEAVNKDSTIQELVEFSKVLEGMNRHASTHAAGVVIAPGELTDYIPLYKSPQGDITSQYDMKGLEDLGLLKMDFLGLRNLTVIDQTVGLLRDRNIQLDMARIPLDDPKVYRTFSKGNTIGVFQFESGGMREYLKKLKPSSIEDLIAMNALYRPGPMEHIDDFISRKRGRTKIEFPHPALEPILKETYGIIVYQEQVMQIANAVAGFSLAQADIMRRAMGKKQRRLMKAQEEAFIEGAGKNKISKKVAREIFQIIEKFAQYGFNKSHSTAYAYIAYQTAYLKTHYPAEFMAANLTSEMNNTARVVTLINECHKVNLTVNPPDVNESDINFKALDEHTISFGLNAIKNVGVKALENIISSREKYGRFSNLFEFCRHLDLRLANKKVIESLIGAGAMDSLQGNRAQKYAAVESALRVAQQVQAEAFDNQFSLFGLKGKTESAVHSPPSLPDMEDWSDSDKLKREKEVMGFYLTGHPLLKYAQELERYSNYDFSGEIDELQQKEIRVGGVVHDVKLHFDKKNHQMAFFSLDCLGGKMEVLVFHDTFRIYQKQIKEDNLVFVSGRPTTRLDENTPKIIAETIQSLTEIRNRLTRKVNILMQVDKMRVNDVDSLLDLARRHTGTSPLFFHVHQPDGIDRKILSHKIRVSPDESLLSKLKDIYGDQNVWVD